MKLRYNRDTELEVVGFGVFAPNEFISFSDEKKAKRYLATGYFDLVKEKKKEPKYKTYILKPNVKKKIKKSKKEGDDK